MAGRDAERSPSNFMLNGYWVTGVGTSAHTCRIATFSLAEATAMPNSRIHGLLEDLADTGFV